jgi:nitrite reductase (NADH) small subunit
MSDWIQVGLLADIPRQGARVLESSRGPIAVFRTVEDEVFAVLDRCPHKGGPLSQGIVHDRKVTCPLHNWVIDLEVGEAVAPDHGCVNRFPVRLEADRVFLQLTEV